MRLKHLTATPWPVLDEAEPGTWGQGPGDNDLRDLGGRGHAMLPAPAAPLASARLSFFELCTWLRFLPFRFPPLLSPVTTNPAADPARTAVLASVSVRDLQGSGVTFVPAAGSERGHVLPLCGKRASVGATSTTSFWLPRTPPPQGRPPRPEPSVPLAYCAFPECVPGEWTNWNGFAVSADCLFL